MGTRSLIAVKINDEYQVIYCQLNGFIEHNGAVLLEHYSDQEKLEQLINLGDLHHLEGSIECPDGHCYETPIDGYTVAFHRDYGFDWERTKPVIVKKVSDLSKICEMAAYVYLLNGGEWLVNQMDGAGFEPLKAILNEEAVETLTLRNAEQQNLFEATA